MTHMVGSVPLIQQVTVIVQYMDDTAHTVVVECDKGMTFQGDITADDGFRGEFYKLSPVRIDSDLSTRQLELTFHARTNPLTVQIVSGSTEPQPCPECVVGKHGNCDGRTLDRTTDEIVPCPCKEAGHE